MKELIRPITILFLTALWLGSATPPAHAQEEGPLTMSSLKAMVRGLGYEPADLKNDKGAVVSYLISVYSGGGNWKITVDLSPNQENVWIYADLALIADINQVPRYVLMDMLKTNETIGPTHFAYNEKIKMFVLYHSITNRGVTSKLLRERIQDVAHQVDIQEKLWNPKLWTTGVGPGPVTTSPEVQRLMKELESPNEMNRLKAAKDLGKLGAAAKGAIPALQRLLTDPDEDVRRVAANAIDRIQTTGPGPGPGPGPATVAGTTWEGNETLSGYGRLKFQFDSDGKAIMYDAMWEKRGTVSGTWTQTGNQVKISFKDCVYEGTVKGDVLAGNAHYLESGNTWTFSLTRLVVATRSALGSKPVPHLTSEGGRRR